MLGLMQDWPLLCHRIIDHAALNHGERCVHSRSVEGPLHTTTYAAGLSASAQNKEAAVALIKAFSGPAAASVLKSKGMDPAN